jgi:hypothetical protein
MHVYVFDFTVSLVRRAANKWHTHIHCAGLMFLLPGLCSRASRVFMLYGLVVLARTSVCFMADPDLCESMFRHTSASMDAVTAV